MQTKSNSNYHYVHALICSAVVISFVCASGLLAQGQKGNAEGHKTKYFQRLREDHSKNISDLIHVAETSIQDPMNPDIKTFTQAVQTLGTLRSPESVPFLVEEIAFPVQRDGKSYVEASGTYKDIALADRCPAIASLADIGIPAVEPVLHRMYSTDDVFVQVTCIEVLALMNHDVPMVFYLRGVAEQRVNASMKRFIYAETIPALEQRIKTLGERPAKTKEAEPSLEEQHKRFIEESRKNSE